MEENTPVAPAAEPAAEAAPAPAPAEPLELKAEVELRELLDAGVHFGHQTKRWNPKMRPYIFDKRNGIHLIDLTQTLALLKQAQSFLSTMAATGRGILFVGTKKQAQTTVADVARQCGQFYVTSRWLGGTLTNNRTVRNSIKRMRQIEKMEKDGEFEKLPKKEVAVLRHELAKLQKNLSGIADMDQLPGAMVVLDIKRESNAVKEANTLNIPVVAMVDTCCDPDPVDYVIPGNDDAIRAIRVILSALGASVRDAHAEWEQRAAEIRKQREADGGPAPDKAAEGRESRPRRPRTGERSGDRPAAPRAPRRPAVKKEKAPAAEVAPAVPAAPAAAPAAPVAPAAAPEAPVAPAAEGENKA